MKIQHRDDTFLGRRIGWTSTWDRDRDGKAKNKEPSCKWKDDRHVRVQLRVPGLCERRRGLHLVVDGPNDRGTGIPDNGDGTNLLDLFSRGSDGDALNTRASMISHRYSTGGRPERAKEALTYHSIVLLEWDHRKYSTVVEIGYLHGVGGCRGKSNWYDDRDAPAGSRLYATYLLDYIRRDCTYSEMRRNCQTMTADLVGFLAGKKDVQPFHPVNQIQYVLRLHLFLTRATCTAMARGRKTMVTVTVSTVVF
ncbi:LOW QUALITY PROTEIN: hypothetical protein ACHAWF_002036 [Thalassiosira exigua]